MTDQTLHVVSLAPLWQNPQNILRISNQLTDNQNLVDQHSQGKVSNVVQVNGRKI